MIKGIEKKISNRHWSLKEKAQELRAQGLSYNEILAQIPVSKSSISLWCRYIVLSSKQKKRLGEKRDHSLRGIHAIQKMFWERRCHAFQEGVRMTKTIRSARFFSGLMLYWAEGDKTIHCAIANSDERIIRFMMLWFKDFYDIKPESISINLHLHSGQNEKKMKEYWSSLTGVPAQNFMKSFVKPEGSGYRKNILYNGTVKLYPRGNSTYLLFKILGSIAGYLEETIGEKQDIEKWIKHLPYA